jgi:hypothetical protein
MRGRLALVAAAVAATCVAGSAEAGPPVPTPPGSSLGTATAESIDATVNHPFLVIFNLQGSLRFGGVTHHGYFQISYADFSGSRATLKEGDTVIAKCTSEDTVFLSQPAPATAVIRCVGHFPEQGKDRATTLVFALPLWNTHPCQKCTGMDYEGQYIG